MYAKYLASLGLPHSSHSTTVKGIEGSHLWCEKCVGKCCNVQYCMVRSGNGTFEATREEYLFEAMLFIALTS